VLVQLDRGEQSWRSWQQWAQRRECWQGVHSRELEGKRAKSIPWEKTLLKKEKTAREEGGTEDGGESEGERTEGERRE
jgi:hypothetical protein